MCLRWRRSEGLYIRWKTNGFEAEVEVRDCTQGGEDKSYPRIRESRRLYLGWGWKHRHIATPALSMKNKGL